jgi:DNA-binding CsgD family transcriptional regulator
VIAAEFDGRDEPMAIDEPILAAIESLYDAALDETLWPATLERLIAVTSCEAATFCILDSADQPRLPAFTVVNFHPRLIEEYLDFMAPQDPTIQYLVKHPRQKIVHDSTFITEHEKDLHPYYDWHHRFTDMRHRVVGMINPAPFIQSGVTLHRSRKSGDFRPETLKLFAALYRHIERALQIGFRLGTLANMQQVSLALLDRNPLAIVLLDDKGRVILANRAARDVAEDADGVALGVDGLRLLRPSDDTALQRLIGEALGMAIASGSGGSMSALRPSGRRPYAIVVSPLSRGSFAVTTLKPSVCIVIADPERHHDLPADRLRDLYGLTPSEARLAVRLAAGEDLQTAAAALGIAYATARTRLVTIFRKTDTKRQGELVKLLLATIPLTEN